MKCIELEHLSQITGQLLGYVNSDEQKSIKNVFKKNDILFGKLRPYLRKFWIAEFDGVCSSEIWVLSGINKICLNEYVFWVVQTHNFIQVANVTSGSKMPRADWDYVSAFPFPLPPITEQKAIAKVLSTWDKAIEKTQELIAQKELRKKALMQQLLTGKKRLPGFSGEWKEMDLGNLFDERNETGYNNLPLLSVGASGIYPQSDSIKKDTSNEDKSKYKRITPGDIGYNTMRMWQGRSALSALEGIVSPAYTIVVPKKNTNTSFFTYLFALPRVVYSFFTHSQGLVDDTLNCKYHDFATVKVFIPNYDEQAAISKILQKADEEIVLQKQKLEILKEQKKGLMQVLLTGKKRIKYEY